MSKHFFPQKGFAILYAVLVASLLLAIGLAIFNLTIKELLLSSSARESQFAFYAADTGDECALYWDWRNTNQFPSFGSAPAWPIEITCNGITIPVTYTLLGDRNTYTFEMNSPAGSSEYCFDVMIEKFKDADNFDKSKVTSN